MMRKIATHYDEKIAKTEAEVQAALEKQQALHESVPKDKYIAKEAACAELTDTYGHVRISTGICRLRIRMI